MISTKPCPANSLHSIAQTGACAGSMSLKSRPCTNKPQAGTSLLEALLVLSITALLVSGIAPALHDLLKHGRADAAQQQLHKAIYRTRSAAIYGKKIVSFCPFAQGGCGKNWNRGAMIFTDQNNNGKIDGNDQLLERIDLRSKQFTLSWRASARKSFLRFSPSGMARAFGRFTLCSESGDLRHARTIVVNRQGRLRQYYDRDGDGIVEDLDGRLPECPD